MLAARHRLRAKADFDLVVRRGVRARGTAIVVHALLTDSVEPARCGFVVGKAVGTAPVRNTVKRRLRHLMRDQVTQLPRGGLFVVRALPASAGLEQRSLGADLSRALRRSLQRAR